MAEALDVVRAPDYNMVAISISNDHAAAEASEGLRRKAGDGMWGKAAYRGALTACLCVVGSTAALALPCALSEADYHSLANATETSYSRADIEALDPKDQEALCKARKFYHEARGKDPRAFARTHTLQDIPPRMSRFLTAEEYRDVRPTMGEVMVEDAVRKRSPSRERK
jgi:hypothetical protein